MGWIEQALEACGQRQYDYAWQAACRANGACETVEEEIEAAYTSGFILLMKDQALDARPWLQQAAEGKEDMAVVDSRRIDAVLLMSETYRREGDVEEAMVWLEHARHLLPYGVISDRYHGEIARAMAYTIRVEDPQRAREEASYALQFIDDPALLRIGESRQWEHEAWRIRKDQSWDEIESVEWTGEGEQVREMLLALRDHDPEGLERSRRALQDPWWIADSLWQSAEWARGNTGQVLSLLDSLSEVTQGFTDKEEWEMRIRHERSRTLMETEPQQVVDILKDDSSEEGKELLLEAAEKSGNIRKAAEIRRGRGEWGIYARELVEEQYAALDRLVGLASVKNTVHGWCDLIQVARMRGERPHAGHIVMSGNPGTGKTTVARFWGKMLWALDLAKNDQTLIVSRADLVAEYVGQTAPRVRAVVERAKGGVLFVDEAYSLAGDEFGAEAVSTLLELMENHRDDLSVVFAGYSTEFPKLWQVNPGLRSRFTRQLDFPDYLPDELAEILRRMLEERNLSLEAKAQYSVQQLLQQAHHYRDKDWANAREIRNILDHVSVFQARRVVSEGATLSNAGWILEADIQEGGRAWWRERFHRG
jgi:Holliday junction resolvasome RuvABC ATP-dependent DNA helicase subunit